MCEKCEGIADHLGCREQYNKFISQPEIKAMSAILDEPIGHRLELISTLLASALFDINASASRRLNLNKEQTKERYEEEFKKVFEISEGFAPTAKEQSDITDDNILTQTLGSLMREGLIKGRSGFIPIEEARAILKEKFTPNQDSPPPSSTVTMKCILCDKDYQIIAKDVEHDTVAICSKCGDKAREGGKTEIH